MSAMINTSNSRECEHQHQPQSLHPFFTTWHITFGAHGARLHGGERPTVDREHNQRGEPFIYRDEEREEAEAQRMNSAAVILTIEECLFIETTIPSICERGKWVLRTCAAPPPKRTQRAQRAGTSPSRTVDGDHVHILLDAPPEAEPKVIRELLKRWLTQAMNKRFPSEPGRPRPEVPEPARPRAGKPCAKQWWAEGGSTKPVKDADYLNNAYSYINRQRATP